MFLAHFSHTPLPAVLDMFLDEIYQWYHEALKLHNKLNPKSDE